MTKQPEDRNDKSTNVGQQQGNKTDQPNKSGTGGQQQQSHTGQGQQGSGSSPTKTGQQQPAEPKR
jgi:hypothetical protein